MSGLQRLPFIAGIAGLGASISILSLPSVRSYLYRYLGLSAPGGIWRILAILLALLNLKNLPFMWHIRLFRALIYHLYLQPTRLTPPLLFQPIVTSSRAPLAECDYNLHKSNSTYFTDLDISRTHLVTALLRTGIRDAGKHRDDPATPSAPAPAHTPTTNGSGSSSGSGSGSGSSSSSAPTAAPDATPPAATAVPPPAPAPPTGAFTIALGGVTAHFRREIPPYARYEVWTRLLCWDRKWLYLVSHVVRPGAARPAAWGLQPWRGPAGTAQGEGGAEGASERPSGAVYASSVARYVVKRGRVTMPPEVVLGRSGLLPPRPCSSSSPSSSSSSPSSLPPPPAPPHESAAPAPAGRATGAWTWEAMERERARGLAFAEMFAGLDGLHELFDGGATGALGEFPDLLW